MSEWRKFGPMYGEPIERMQTTNDRGDIVTCSVVESDAWVEIMGTRNGYHEIVSTYFTPEEARGLAAWLNRYADARGTTSGTNLSESGDAEHA